MNISKIEIRNVQAHKSIDIDLREDVTAILGKSDRGKSSIVRAVNWFFIGRPNWKKMLRHRETTMSVALVCENGDFVMRSRSAAKNAVEVHIKGSPVERYTSFGEELPQEVMRFLKPYRVNDEIVNIQLQHSQLFGVSCSGRTRMEMMCGIAGTDVLDSAAAILNADVVRSSRDKGMLKERSLALSSEIKRLASEINQRLPIVDALKKKIKRLSDFQQNALSMDDAIFDFESAEKDLSECGRKISSGEFSRIERLLSELSEHEDQLEKVQYIINDFMDAEEEVQSTKREATIAASEVAIFEKSFHSELKRSGVCPTCGARTA